MDIPMTAQAIRRLRAAKGAWPIIARDIGVSYSWICKVAQGHITNPSARRIESVLQYFELLDQQVAKEQLRRQKVQTSVRPKETTDD